ncbi:unnamed protein product [Acanthoscelides obtectus]|nr:unnamed protein product [Acanthoscelides obtectus]CAK1648227.1 hypothetical protein AOBTE_LOCUS15612 [Acanthoscelides obtectus]
MNLISKYEEPRRETIIEEDPLCRCTKNIRTMKQKTEDWRNECVKYRALIRRRKFPNYFSSQFCKIFKTRI